MRRVVRFVCSPGADPFAARALDRALAALAVAHRGPGGLGRLETQDAALANTRLSIVDLPSVSQPMTNENGGVVVYDGEIRNHAALGAALGHRYRGRSDDHHFVGAG